MLDPSAGTDVPAADADRPSLPRSPTALAIWLLSKPFPSIWANLALFTTVWALPSAAFLAGMAARGELFSRPPGEGFTLAAGAWFYGLFLVLLSASGAHGLWRDRRAWPQVNEAQAEMLFREAQRLGERRDQVRLHWVSAVGLAYSGLLAAWWWIVTQDPSQSRFGLGLQAGVFGALAVISAVACLSVLGASGTANSAMTFLQKTLPKHHPLAVFASRVRSATALNLADVLVFETLLVLTSWWIYPMG